jgi:hypothetical protein
MKKSVYSSICIVMLMGLLPFSPKAQDTVIYPYMNYLNMPCDDPSEYFCYNTQRGGHGNDGLIRVCEKDSVYEAGVFNYPVLGKPDTRLIYGVAVILRSREEHSNVYEIEETNTIDIELYKVTEGESDIHLIKKMTGYLYPGKKPDKILKYQPGPPDDSEDPMYEFYFDEPVSITGTFLATASISSDYTGLIWYYLPRTEVTSYEAFISKKDQKIIGVRYATDESLLTFYCDTTGLPAPDIELEGIKSILVQWIFPILVPEGTTAVPTVEGGETFEVLLTPNPAAEQATAATEAGIRSIEVVDMAGRIVVRHSYPALPRNVTFDVKALPRGIYAVRVDTPQGIATKKLAVE